MYWLKYCFAKPPLLLTEEQTRVYCQMVSAVNKGVFEIRKAF